MSDVEIKKVEDYLKIKYGITKLCQSPNTPPEGYVYNSCNTELENLAASECSISCAAGYSASRFVSPYVTCADSGEDFKFYGCFPDNENSRSPPSFVSTDHVGHWNTFNGITLNADGKVSSWSSYSSQSNATPSLSSVKFNNFGTNNEHFEITRLFHFANDYFQILNLILSLIKQSLPELSSQERRVLEINLFMMITQPVTIRGFIVVESSQR